MNNLKIKSIIFISLLFLFNSCNTDEPMILDPCDNLEGRIHEELRSIFPYSINLKGIIFENSNGEEFTFEVLEKRDAIVLVNANAQFPYEAERLEFELFNSELDIYFTITLYGGYATFMCPELATPGGFISIKGPLDSGTPTSSPLQSYNLIIVEIINDEINIEMSDYPSFVWEGKSYDDVYEGRGDMVIYFNFDLGVIGFHDPGSDLNFAFKSILTE